MKAQSTRSSNGHRSSRVSKSIPSVKMTAKSESPEKISSQARLMPSSNPLSRKGTSIVIFDTNIYLSHPKCIETFLKKGFDVFIPSMVLEELDVCKDDHKNKEKSARALAAQKKILQYLEEENPRIRFSANRNYSNLPIEKKDRSDAIILAAVNWVLVNTKRNSGDYARYQQVLFVTNDIGFSCIARVLLESKGLQIESYKEEKRVKENSLNIRVLKISGDNIYNRAEQQYYPLKGDEKIAENEAVIVNTDYRTGEWRNFKVAVRKDKELIFISPHISASNFVAKPNGRPNWEQMLAMHYLMDPEVTCTILQGPAGTGKTLVALAAALELVQKSKYDRISIYRPMVSVDKDGVGFLPGDEKSKVAPWMRPIFRNLEKILKRKEQTDKGDGTTAKKQKRKKKGEENIPKFNGILQGSEGLQIMSELKIDAEILSFTCGETIDNRIMIVDDAQNMTEQEFLNILTRVGENTKIIITGDLQQIHMKGLAKEQSGLYHAVNLLKGGSQIGIVNFTDETIVRSEFVKFVVKKFSRKHDAA